MDISKWSDSCKKEWYALRKRRKLESDVIDLPILFKGDMVLAILKNRKCQTRRLRGLEVVNKNPSDWQYIEYIPSREIHTFAMGIDAEDWEEIRCPYGRPGDRLWVREKWREQPVGEDGENEIQYKADFNEGELACYGRRGGHSPRPWKPSIHMFRHMSRILLEVVSVRVERVQDISEEDAIQEGIERIGDRFKGYMKLFTGEEYNPAMAGTSFSQLWDSINGKKHPWESNPWVWVIEFKVLEVHNAG